MAASNYRTIAAHWDEIWPRIAEATDPKQVSQRKCLSLVKKSEATAPRNDTCTLEDLQSLVGQREFGCIYADPPWLYDNQATRASTSNHYGGMTVDELCELPIEQLAAKDAHLHLWITNAFLFDAPRIFDAWGFEFRSSFVWCKPQMGIGNYWRNSHEILLTAIRGNAKRFNDRSLLSWGKFNRTRHSAKPEEIRGFIERASAGPYLELFGRRKVEGWTVWGNEIERNLFNP
jgi:N6-adenosine-specific RNA methylase IME4